MMGKSVLRCASAWLLTSDASEAETRGNQRGGGWLLVGWGSCLQACIRWSGPWELGPPRLSVPWEALLTGPEMDDFYPQVPPY